MKTFRQLHEEESSPKEAEMVEYDDVFSELIGKDVSVTVKFKI